MGLNLEGFSIDKLVCSLDKIVVCALSEARSVSIRLKETQFDHFNTVIRPRVRNLITRISNRFGLLRKVHNDLPIGVCPNQTDDIFRDTLVTRPRLENTEQFRAWTELSEQLIAIDHEMTLMTWRLRTLGLVRQGSKLCDAHILVRHDGRIRKILPNSDQTHDQWTNSSHIHSFDRSFYRFTLTDLLLALLAGVQAILFTVLLYCHGRALRDNARRAPRPITPEGSQFEMEPLNTLMSHRSATPSPAPSVMSRKSVSFSPKSILKKVRTTRAPHISSSSDDSSSSDPGLEISQR